MFGHFAQAGPCGGGGVNPCDVGPGPGGDGDGGGLGGAGEPSPETQVGLDWFGPFTDLKKCDVIEFECARQHKWRRGRWLATDSRWRGTPGTAHQGPCQSIVSPLLASSKWRWIVVGSFVLLA